MRLQTGVFTILIAAAPFLLQATPTIRVKGDPPNPTIIVSNNFTFGADSLGGGVLSFQNESGQDWLDLSVTATLPEFTPITCGPGPFLTCTISTAPMGSNFLYTILFGPVTSGGIPNGGLFSVNLNDNGDDPSGIGSWGAGTDFGAKANVTGTPEPSAALLVVAGFLGLAAWRKTQRRAVSE